VRSVDRNGCADFTENVRIWLRRRQTGYQSGAEVKAKAHKIELLIVREQSDKDWQDKEGNPYIKQIHFNGHLMPPIRIVNFDFNVDENWVEENGIDKATILKTQNALTDQVTIEEKENTYTIAEFAGKVGLEHREGAGEFVKEKDLEDSYIKINGKRLKILGYKMKYQASEPASFPFVIDFSKELVGVIEYVHTNRKSAIFKDRVVTDR